MTVPGLFEDSLPFHRQTDGKDVAAEGHTLSSPLARRPRQQANQRQVVVVAQAVIIWVEEDLGHGVLLLILFRDQSMIVPQPDLVLLGGVAVPAGGPRTAEPFSVISQLILK